MTITTAIRFGAAGLIAAGALSPVALAGGEPKNDWPFTRSVTYRAPAQVQQSDSQAVIAAGEPKNQWPFTRPVVGATSQAALSAPVTQVGKGEAKNGQPFTQPVLTPAVLVRANGGFDWGDAAIGVAAGLGIALAMVGALLLVTHRGPHARKIGAAATR
jgi:hypothetical protein